MKIRIPEKVGKILNIFDDYRFEAYIVGGCVRDSLLGKIPGDWDICTNAAPEQVMDMFQKEGYKTIPTGLKHGTVTVVAGSESFEITTYRIDGSYEGHRRPSSVFFTDDIRGDLSRRDFTVNAMAYHPIKGFVDPFDGKKDLEKRIIKCVGNPGDRFHEDALRMLRAVRFCAQLNFSMDPQTKEGICRHGQLLQNISKERIREEFNRILLSDVPSQGVRDLVSTGLIQWIIPELMEAYGFFQHDLPHDKDLFHHILAVLDYTEKDLVLRLAALFHDIGKPRAFVMDKKGVEHAGGHHLQSMHMAGTIMKRLKYDHKTVERVKILVREHVSEFEEIEPKTIKKFIHRLGVENLKRLLKLQIADKKGTGNSWDYSHIVRVQEEAKRILDAKEPLTVKDLDIKGSDLLKLGIPQGKQIGEILNRLLELVWERPELNHKEELLKHMEWNMIEKAMQ